MAVLPVLLFVAAVALVVWLAYRRKAERRRALTAFAAERGLAFSRDDTAGLLGYRFHLLSMGKGRGCENVMSGTWQGLPVREADYWYYTESTDSQGHRSRSYRYFSILMADLPLTLPELSIQRESFLSRLADRVGLHDIDFESEAFNRMFQVTGSDRRFAFELVDARMMRWLLETEGAFGFESRGSTILAWSKRLAPARLGSLFDAARAFREHIPALVWKGYGTEAGSGVTGMPG